MQSGSPESEKNGRGHAQRLIEVGHKVTLWNRSAGN